MTVFFSLPNSGMCHCHAWSLISYPLPLFCTLLVQTIRVESTFPIVLWLACCDSQAQPGKRPKGPCRPNFSVSSHFVLWEATSQTKYCFSPKVKNFELVTPLLRFCTKGLNTVPFLLLRPATWRIVSFLIINSCVWFSVSSTCRAFVWGKAAWPNQQPFSNGRPPKELFCSCENRGFVFPIKKALVFPPAWRSSWCG